MSRFFHLSPVVVVDPMALDRTREVGDLQLHRMETSLTRKVKSVEVVKDHEIHKLRQKVERLEALLRQFKREKS